MGKNTEIINRYYDDTIGLDKQMSKIIALADAYRTKQGYDLPKSVKDRLDEVFYELDHRLHVIEDAGLMDMYYEYRKENYYD